jgi:ribose transport system permease protein
MKYDHKKKLNLLMAWNRLYRSSLFGALIIILVLLGGMLIIKPTYLSGKNINALTTVLSVTAVVGFSQMVIIAAGGLNLSIGAIGALSAVAAGWAMTKAGAPWWISVMLCLLTGLLCGISNGLLIYRAGGVGVGFFLTTLATASVFMGLNLTITRGNPFYGPNGKIDRIFLAIGRTRMLGLPSSFFIMLAIMILLILFFTRMPSGKQILAFGANHKAAEMYGVSKFKVVMTANVISGLLASVAGCLAMIRIEAAQPNMGSDWLLMSFAAPLIGGTILTGGKVNVIGAVLGAVTLTIISNALIHLKIDTYWSMLIYGLIILLAVSIDRFRYLKKAR